MARTRAAVAGQANHRRLTASPLNFGSSYSGSFDRPSRPFDALLFAAREDLWNGLESQRPIGPGALDAPRAPPPSALFVARCGPVSRGDEEAEDQQEHADDCDGGDEHALGLPEGAVEHAENSLHVVLEVRHGHADPLGVAQPAAGGDDDAGALHARRRARCRRCPGAPIHRTFAWLRRDVSPRSRSASSSCARVAAHGRRSRGDDGGGGMQRLERAGLRELVDAELGREALEQRLGVRAAEDVAAAQARRGPRPSRRCGTRACAGGPRAARTTASRSSAST